MNWTTKKKISYYAILSLEKCPHATVAFPKVFIFFLLWLHSNLKFTSHPLKALRFPIHPKVHARIGPPLLHKASAFLLQGEYGLAGLTAVWFRCTALSSYYVKQAFSWYFEKFSCVPVASAVSENVLSFIHTFCRPQNLHCKEAKYDYCWILHFKEQTSLKN
jgi:hypothetical protein